MKQYKKSILAEMNQVQLYKRLYLPCELVDLKGDTQTQCFEVFKET